MKLLLLFVLLAFSLFVTSCKTPVSSGSSSLAPSLSDAVLVAQVGMEYEALAKTKKVTLADYSTVASNAVKNYRASHGIPASANVDNLLAMANAAVQLYAMSKSP